MKCIECQKEFEPKREWSKYCSTNCRVKAKRKVDTSNKPAGIIARSQPASLPASEPDPRSVDIIKIKEADLKAKFPLKKLPPIKLKKTHSLGYDREKNLAAFQKMGLEAVTWITTGIPEFDELTQIPRGRVTQIQGPYAVGKTTLCLNMLKGLRDKRILYIDTEAALNPELLTSLELEADKFTLYNQSAFIEDVYDVIVDAVKGKARYDMIILDSLAACTFRVEAANEAADANIGQKAKIVGKLMRIIPMELKRTGTALVIINQERETIGGYGPIKYTPGGQGVLYAASLMVSLKTTKAGRFPSSGPPFKGQEVSAEIIKSKVNTPWRKTAFKLFYG